MPLLILLGDPAFLVGDATPPVFAIGGGGGAGGGVNDARAPIAAIAAFSALFAASAILSAPA
eukprot:CAMPEP_0180298110 /NCGR_PEP_ID=MMETSP0988-20121125/21007_1 /TAXON_ID=697907 /ORGANISM="non described non described, Strain CCMP2293" /LENGTH=61 /DNA_ID=CAMNT_0022277033 /DNA_START=582 /DNA_END=763 /DNA_ORIENTATION=-